MSSKWESVGGISEVFWTGDRNFAFQRVGEVWNLYAGDEMGFRKDFRSFVDLQMYIWQCRDEERAKTVCKYAYEIQGNYGSEWETIITEETVEEANEMLSCYDLNEPQYPHRVKKVLVE